MKKFEIGKKYRTTLNNDARVTIEVLKRTDKTITVMLQPGTRYEKEIRTKLTDYSATEETTIIKNMCFGANSEI